MKKAIAVLSITIILITTSAFSQTKLKEYKTGNVFNISLPDYMTKTIGMNSSSAIEFKSELKDVYGFVIEDTKEDLQLAELNYTSINEFYEDFIKDFAKDESERKVSNPIIQKKGSINFIESDLTYYNVESKIGIYYLIGIVETKSAYYKVLSWSAIDDKDKFKEDFKKILYSIKD